MGAPAQPRSVPILLLDRLADPPPARAARERVAVSGPALGLVLAVLTGLGLLLIVIGLAVLAGAGRRSTMLSIGSGPAAAALVLQALADLLVLVGGWRMAQRDRRGREPVVLGLLIALVGAAIGGGGGLAVEVVVLVALYVLVVVSRFPEPASVGAGPAVAAAPAIDPPAGGDGSH